MTKEINRIPQVIAELHELRHAKVIIGVPLDDSFLQMIGIVNETGRVIVAHKNWLTIPTRAAGKRKASEIPGLFKPRGKNILAVANGKSLTVMFILKKSVKIPPRAFLRNAWNHHREEWAAIGARGVRDIVNGRSTARMVMMEIGMRVKVDIQNSIRKKTYKPNAPLTVANKGFNNPLQDTNALLNSITYVIR